MGLRDWREVHRQDWLRAVVCQHCETLEVTYRDCQELRAEVISLEKGRDQKYVVVGEGRHGHHEMRLVVTVQLCAPLDLDGRPPAGRALVDEAVDAAVADWQKNVEVALGAGLDLGPDQELDDLPDRAVVG